MKYNGRILGKAYAMLAEVRERNEAEHERRKTLVYSGIPEIEEADRTLQAQMPELMRLITHGGSGSSEQIRELKEKNLDLQMKKAELLVRHGYPSDWLDEIFTCSRCRDTGTLDGGKPCSCLEKYYNKALTGELSSLLRSGDESFENFDITLYPEEYSERFKCIPRKYMRKVYDGCRTFADSFPAVSSGLLLLGGPGLGKTYLSACIARVVSANGYSVCYETAVEAFHAFEQRQFSRLPEEQSAADEKVRHLLECDLLILDDLGTEVVTQSVLSALYTLLNTRENAGKHMIISTTLSGDELQARYTASILSRLDGYFTKIRFAGNDIRQLMKRPRG